VQYKKNTNSGRRNLLNVKSHIEKIGFELEQEIKMHMFKSQ